MCGNCIPAPRKANKALFVLLSMAVIDVRRMESQSGHKCAIRALPRVVGRHPPQDTAFERHAPEILIAESAHSNTSCTAFHWGFSYASEQALSKVHDQYSGYF